MTTEEKRNDEIDLIEVFTNIYLFFKKHFWFLFGAVLVGAILGYSTKFNTPKFYESSMLIESEILANDIIMEYINNIQTLLDDKNYILLQEKMGIDSTELVDIKSIDANFVYDEKEKKKLNYLSVKAITNNNKVLKTMDQGILNFIDKEEYFQNEIEIFKKNTQNLIQNINQEIHKIEQLQANFISPQNKNGEIKIYYQQKSLQEELLLLTKEKQELEKAIQLAAPFRVIKDFTIYKNPKTKTKTYTLAGALIFGLLALLILIIRNTNRSLKEKGIS
jgi:uncharacterized protein involved in exopolysaccharide biosynthesis